MVSWIVSVLLLFSWAHVVLPNNLHVNELRAKVRLKDSKPQFHFPRVHLIDSDGAEVKDDSEVDVNIQLLPQYSRHGTVGDQCLGIPFRGAVLRSRYVVAQSTICNDTVCQDGRP